MKICFAAIPGYGHTFPLVPLAAAAQSAGHEVVLVSGDEFLGRLPVPVIRGLPPGLTREKAEAETVRLAVDRTEPFWFPKALFGTVMPRHTAPLVREHWAQTGSPDALVYEIADLGPAQVAAEAGVPAFAFNIGMLAEQWLAMRPAGMVLPAPTVLDPSPPTWRGTRGTGELRRIPIRTVAWSFEGGAGADWLAGAASGPRAYLTLGTVSFGAVEVLRRSILAAAEACERVLVAAGPEGDPAALGDLPSSVRVERFVDQGAVLSQADVAVHHGGTGTLLACLAQGVPQIITPQGADQFVNAERLNELGLGRSVGNEAGPDVLGRTLSELLSDRALLSRTAAMRAEIAAMPGPDEVVDQLVELVSQGW